MDDIRQAVEKDLVIDITTTGRKTGQPRRVEIWRYLVDGEIYLSGSPGKRDWYANIVANPQFIYHLKRSMQADIPATGTPVTDPAARRQIMQQIIDEFDYHNRGRIDEWVAEAPLVKLDLHFDEAERSG